MLKNITDWRLENTFFIEHCAIDLISSFKDFGTEKSKGMFDRLNGSLEEFNWKNWEYTGKQTVRAKTLNQVCPNPNILKIDIERYEYTVLPEIVKNDSIQVIYLELHGPCYPLNIIDFLNSSLAGTKLKVTGWYHQHQTQTEEIDKFEEIKPQKTIDCGKYEYVIIEKDESL